MDQSGPFLATPAPRQPLRRLLRALPRRPRVLVSLAILAGFLCVGIFAQSLAPYGGAEKHFDANSHLLRLLPPSRDFVLGTTLYGRDVFSQLILGTRTALVVGLLTALATSLIGVNVGLLAGYFGGAADAVLMRATDVVFCVPVLPFCIVSLSILNRSTGWIIAVMALLFWPITARVIRSQVLSLKERPFTDAARMSGAGHLRILYKHIAPNVMPQALVHGVFAIAWAITTEASINFLGFGDPNALSWGTIVYDVFTSMVSYTAWWWFLPPGICIMLVVGAFYLVSEEYEEIANPRLQKR
ncbi:MAG: ABC transporter permease [Alphaproteobacteria bacterium]